MHHPDIPKTTDPDEQQRQYRERIKELNCLYDISEIIEIPNISLEAILQKTAQRISDSWQYPGIARARISLNGRQYQSEAFRESPLVQKADITVYGRTTGAVEVFYLEKRPAEDEGPFLKEERKLLNAIAERLGRVAERKLTEKKLQENEERLELALRGAELGTWDWNVQTGEIIINDRWAEMLGYTRSEIEPRIEAWEDAVHPEDLPQTRKLLNALLAGKIPFYQSEFRMRHKSGDWVWILDQGKIIEWDEAGRALRSCGTHMDITDRKQAEEKLLESQERLNQAQKMEAIGTLAGGIAHDFNNILTGILGFAELARDDLAKGLPLKEYLDDILQLGNRAKDLTQQILTFSRKSARESAPILLQPVVKECLKMLRATIPMTIELRQNINPNCSPVTADPVQMHQLVMNLCTNAAYEMKNTGGELEVLMDQNNIPEPILCPDGTIAPGKFVILKVRDSGRGIPEENISRVFEPFFTTKARGKGTGMGLAVVYGIARSHGGTITVESKPGQGTTFTVLLPCTSAAASAVSETDEKSASAGKESILFVDDENAIVETAHRFFTRLGYNITTVQNASQALTLFRDEPDAYDIIITDQTMPKMTGFQLAQKLLDIRPELPIILCTGFSETVTAEMAKAAGIREFVTKPFNRKNLAASVRRILDQDGSSDKQTFKLRHSV